MEQSYDVVIVGAGIAGLSAAHAARQCNTQASILLINGEDRLPYLRKELSKSLADGYDSDSLTIHKEQWFSDNTITLIRDSVTAIEPDNNQVRLESGGAIVYRSLVIATGSEPLYPSIIRHHERGSFYVVRNAKDADELRSATKNAKAVLVAGMGVLALEVTNQLRKMGKTVTLAGAAPQLMPRQLNVRAGEILEQVLSDKKVRLLFQEEILSFEKNKKGKWAVSLLKHQGHYDLVVFCIGVRPRAKLARAAGLDVGRGIRVNDRFQTSVPNIYAAGDVAELPSGHVSYLWRDAEHQGTLAGNNVAGCDLPWDGRPFALAAHVFGQYVFSCNRPENLWDYQVDDFDVKNRYYALYWQDGQLHGAVMVNDEPRAEDLEKAIHERWDRERVLDHFRLLG